MAKGNLILGTASGKLGDTVMYRKDGQQLSRVRVRKIGNPRTQSQAVNRALLNTLSVAYAYMKGIVDHSFQGLSKPVENQRKFAKLNQGIARETGSVAVPGTDTGYNFNFKGESLLRPNRYAISRGTMPSVEVFNIAAAGGLIAGFQLNQALTALLDTTTTYKQFCDAIGVAVGTQLTFCIVSDDTFTGTPSESNMPKSYGNFHFARIILSDDAGNGDVPMFASEAGDIVINPNYTNSKNSGALKFKRLGESSLRIEVEGHSYPLAMGVIVSNYASRMWLRSNTDMVVAEGYEDSNTMSEVYGSYMFAETTPNSNLYLNQGEGNKQVVVTDDMLTVYDDSSEVVNPIASDEVAPITAGAPIVLLATASINISGATATVRGYMPADQMVSILQRMAEQYSLNLSDDPIRQMLGQYPGTSYYGYCLLTAPAAGNTVAVTVGSYSYELTAS